MRLCAVAAITVIAVACGGRAPDATPASTPLATRGAASATAVVPATAALATVAPAPTGTVVAASLWSPIPAPSNVDVDGAQWVAIPMPSGRVSRAAVFRPPGPGPFPVVLVLHGTEGFKTKHVQFAKDLASSGLITVAVCWYAGNYAGAPGNRQNPPLTDAPDGIACPDGPDFAAPSTPAVVQRLQMLVAAVQSLPAARSDRVGLFGHSRGSVAALVIAATTPEIRAVVAAAGYPDPSTLTGETAPILVLQGTADEFYPEDARPARAFEAAMRGAGKDVESHYVEGAPHQFVFEPQWHDEAVRVAGAFLAERLR